MNTKYITLAIALGTAAIAQGQQFSTFTTLTPVITLNPSVKGGTLLSHWDMNDGSGGFDSSAIPEANNYHCVTPSDMTAIQEGSWSSTDSESGVLSGANCFQSITSTTHATPGITNVVSFKITTDADAFGSINRLNFDIGTYGTATTPNQYQVKVIKNGDTANAVTTTLAAINATAYQNSQVPTGATGAWAGTPNKNHFFTGLNTTLGSSDMFEFEISTYGGAGTFALDNVRIYGNITCVPEPSTALLGALALGSAAFSRRRK